MTAPEVTAPGVTGSRSRSRSRSRRRALLVAVALLLPALAGCEQDQLGAAAIVDEQKITISEVQGALQRVREARERFGVPLEELPQAAANEVHRRVIILIYARAAEDLGITVTEGELAARAAELREQAGGDEAFERTQLSRYGNTLQYAEDEIRLQLIQAKIAEKLNARAGRTLPQAELVAAIDQRLKAAAASMSIRVNPRYGTFDPQSGRIDPFRYDYMRYPQGAAVAPPGTPP